jgi:eukaryotic-like serine/threonine-protein kinase
MNMDGSDPQQITNMSDGACQPDWSPNGLSIIFISPCPARQNDHPGANLYVINIDGKGLIKLPPQAGGAFDPAWSPDGIHLAFASLQNGLSQIYVMNLNDYNVTPLTDTSTDVRLPDWSRQPAWSPDGKQIVYTGHSRLTDALQIWVMSDMGQGQTLLVHRGSTYWDFQPYWSADSKRIIFSETSGSQLLGWLMVFDYENRQNAEAVHLRLDSYGNHGSFSPDGFWVIYESINTSRADSINYHIYLLQNEKGSLPIDLHFSPGSDFDPAMRPVVSP